MLHAVATPYRERSHFDGQDVLENGGTTAPAASDGGWLNRALGGARAEATRAIAIALARQRAARAARRRAVTIVGAVAAARCRPTTRSRAIMRSLRATTPLLSSRLRDALATRTMAGDAGGGGGRPASAARVARRRAARRRSSARPRGSSRRPTARGSRCSTSTAGTRTRTKARAQGQLARGCAGSTPALQTLKTRARRRCGGDTTVLVVTEFGRTVAVNGTRGTDHGTGGVAFLAGGAVNGRPRRRRLAGARRARSLSGARP